MGKTTTIETFDSSWNPITGCRHECVFCYAKRIADRFAGYVQDDGNRHKYSITGYKGTNIYTIESPMTKQTKSGEIQTAVYPFGFEPTFYPYKLNEPQSWKEPKNIFVCSMADLFGCYDDKTEVLTKDGWKFFRDLQYEDYVGYLDENSGEIKYANPETITKMPYKGIMYHVKTRSVDICVTPNHKMYVAMRPTTVDGRKKLKNQWDYNLVAAEDLYQKTYVLKRDFIWKGKEQIEFHLPNSNIVFPMDLWLEFFGYYISEGSAFVTCGRNRVSMPQKKQGNNFYDVCKKIAEICGNKIQILEDRCIIQNKDLMNYLQQFGKSYNKYISSEYKNLSSRQLLILLNALIEGDGRILKNLKSEAYSYYTVSKKLADDIQEIAMKCGFVANITSREPRKNNRYNIIGTSKLYEVIITSKTKRPEVCSNRNKLRGQTIPEKYELYDGIVYCCEVPSHILMVRRNGKTCWCGNSWIPDEWIQKVFDACDKAPQHRYFFLTKNPMRYTYLKKSGKLPKRDNFWYGTTITNETGEFFAPYFKDGYHCFLSIEPIQENIFTGWEHRDLVGNSIEWIIVGAETGNRVGKVRPKKEWILKIAEVCENANIPLFMKDSLQKQMGDDFKQEFPWQN